jgi:hypothetical protein
MRVLKFVLSAVGLSVAGLSLMVGFSGPSSAQGPTFTLQACSGWPRPVVLALVHRTAPNEQKFVVRGWFGLPPRQCGSLDIPRGNFATFAFSINSGKVDKVWGGQGDKAIPVCVDVSKDEFQRIVTDNYQCKEENGEALVPFQLWRVTNEPGVKITFN